MIGLFGLVVRNASAQQLGFDWRGPACRDGQPAFEAQLGALVKPADRARLAGSVTVSPVGSRFAVRLEVSLGGRALGERSFEADDCAGAAKIAAIGAAMAAFSEDSPAAPEAAGPAAAAAPPAREPDPEPDFSRARPAPTERAWRPRPRVGVLGVAQTGVLPGPAWGGALELGVGLSRRWSVAIQGSISAKQARDVGDERQARLRLLTGAARGCFAPLLSERLRFDGCAGAQLLWVRGDGSGFDVNHSASLLAAAPLLGFDFSVRAPDFVEWRAEAEGFAPLSRRRFLVDGREVARAAAVGFTVRLGPVLRF